MGTPIVTPLELFCVSFANECLMYKNEKKKVLLLFFFEDLLLYHPFS